MQNTDVLINTKQMYSLRSFQQIERKFTSYLGSVPPFICSKKRIFDFGLCYKRHKHFQRIEMMHSAMVNNKYL